MLGIKLTICMLVLCIPIILRIVKVYHKYYHMLKELKDCDINKLNHLRSMAVLLQAIVFD